MTDGTTSVHVLNISVYENRERARVYWHDFLCEDMIVRGRVSGVKMWSDLLKLKRRLRKHPDDIWFVMDPGVGKILGVLFAVCETKPSRRIIVYSAADRNTHKGEVDYRDGREWCDVFNKLLERLAKSNQCTSIVYQGPPSWAAHFPSRVIGDDGLVARTH